ncbi:DUF502 domain-containing protein [Zobellella aerophila]|uniref:DUF502 domain-containing protein n=1 Tax=Zobellella aerophila TaxID=870480 RepID=A0ABP6WDT7_9GAMM
MVKFISKNILTGLITLLPVTLTLYLLYWIIISMEAVLGNLIRALVPYHWYVPGLGLLVGCILAFVVGLLMHAYVVQSLFARGEQLLYRMPVIKSIYRAIRDFFDYFSPETRKEFEQVVAVRLGDSELELIGFVTQAKQERLPPGLRQAGYVLVYLPLSYMIGGYAVLIPSSAVRPLDMSLEEAMRFTLTAGVTGIRPKPGSGKGGGEHKSDAGG